MWAQPNPRRLIPVLREWPVLFTVVGRAGCIRIFIDLQKTDESEKMWPGIEKQNVLVPEKIILKTTFSLTSPPVTA